MKKIPQRMCLCCRKMFPKADLTRVVKNKDEQILVDLTGKMNGRGAYICTSDECFEKMKKQKIFNRAFSCNVKDEVYDIIKEAIKNNKK